MTYSCPRALMDLARQSARREAPPVSRNVLTMAEVHRLREYAKAHAEPTGPTGYIRLMVPAFTPEELCAAIREIRTMERLWQQPGTQRRMHWRRRLNARR